MDYAKLKAVLAAIHPTTGEYAADDAEATAQGNLANVEVDVKTVTGQAIYEASTVADRALLTADQRAEFFAIVGMGTILVNGENTKAALLGMFRSGTQTRVNLGELQKQMVSHFASEGLGTPTVGDIQRVRAE